MSARKLPIGGKRRRADDPAILELLDTVREARTSLAIDLAAAAGAIDAGRPEVARDIVAATANEMRRVNDRSQLEVRVDVPSPRRTRRRALLALPAIPLVGALAMTTASALSSGSTQPQPSGYVAPPVAITAASPATATPDSTPAATRTRGATTTLHRLEHVVAQHPQAAQVLAVADDLHSQLTAMIANATDDPARLHIVRHLLMLEQHVLESVKAPGTQVALAASRAIARLLDLVPVARPSATPTPTATVPATAPKQTPAMAPTATTDPRNSTSHASAPSSDASAASNGQHMTTKHSLFGQGLFYRH